MIDPYSHPLPLSSPLLPDPLETDRKQNHRPVKRSKHDSGGAQCLCSCVGAFYQVSAFTVSVSCLTSLLWGTGAVCGLPVGFFYQGLCPHAVTVSVPCHVCMHGSISRLLGCFFLEGGSRRSLCSSIGVLFSIRFLLLSSQFSVPCLDRVFRFGAGTFHVLPCRWCFLSVFSCPHS